MTEEEAKEIIKNLFLMPTDWKIRKSYKGKLDFIGAIEGNEALELILNLIQKQDTEINKLKRALDEMANTLDLNLSLSVENYKFGKKEKIKEYFMKE